MKRSILIVVLTSLLAFICYQFWLAKQPVVQLKKNPLHSSSDTLSIYRSLSNLVRDTVIKNDSAIVLLKKVLQQSKEAAYDLGIATSYYYLGVRYNEKRDYDSALIYYKKAATKCSTSILLQPKLYEIYYKQAATYQNKGDHLAEIESLHKSLYYADKYYSDTLLYQKKARSLILLGAAFSELKRASSAMFFLNQADSFAKRINDDDIKTNILLQKGLVYTDLYNNTREGIRFFSEAKILTDKHKLHKFDNIIWSNLGMAYLKLDSIPQALAIAQDLAKFTKTITHGGKIHMQRANQNAVIATVGKIYLAAKDYKNAGLYMQQSLQYATDFKLTANKIDAHLDLYKIFQAQQNYEQALVHRDAYIALKDSIENVDINNNIRELEIKYRSSEKDKAIAEKQLLIEKQNNRLVKNNVFLVLAMVLVTVAILLIILYRNRSVLHKREFRILKQEHEISMLKGVMEGEQNERTRLAGELHDGIGGMLAVLKMEMNAVRKQHQELKHSQAVAKVNKLIAATADEIRRTAHNLMPDALTRYPLKDAVLMYRDNVCNNTTPMTIDVTFIDDDIETIANNIKLIIFRAIQEIVQNIINHANATHAVIQIIEKKGVIKIIAEDNGKGFNPDDIRDGIGLKNLDLKIKALGGGLTINSSPTHGTTIMIEFPTFPKNRIV